MKPVKLDLEMWTDSTFHETVEVTVNAVPQDFTAWLFKGLAAETFQAAAALFELTVTAGAGILTLHLDVAPLVALFPEGETRTSKTIPWVLKAKPGTTYPVRLAYGTITVRKGLPPWL